jgi:ribosomal protein S18 acetylase RimI-like enzyme
MEFSIDSADSLLINDQEISGLLTAVYVGGGFTDPKTADTLFGAAAVRARGKMIGARDKISGELAGIVIVVPPHSPASRFAGANETEMHLLAVKEEFRSRGLGMQLVSAAIEDAQASGYVKMLLWTQPAMAAAHKLYEKAGFSRRYDKDFWKNNREFWFYEKELHAMRQTSNPPHSF